MRPGLAVLAFAAILAGVSAPAHAGTVSYAIVIGNNAPPVAADEDLAALRYADDDAVRYHQLFAQLGQARLLAGLDDMTQRRYPGLAATAASPTLANLRLVVASYAEAMAADAARGDDTVLYVTFSGHGARDPQGHAYLALLDGALSQDVLFDEVLAKLPASYAHLIIDACHAGGVVGVRGDFFAKEAEGDTDALSAAELDPIIGARRIAAFPHVGVILATSLGQEAHEWSEIEAGVLSHELISGLLGPADVNSDGEIEYTEIQAFIAAANRNIQDPRAIPHVIARPPSANRNASIVSLARFAGSRVLAGEVGGLGHFHLELENGQRYLDAHLAEGAHAVVVVPAAGEVFLITEREEARLPVQQLVSFGELQLARRAAGARGSIERAYRNGLFSSPYSRSYYQGYVDSIGGLGVRFAETTPRRDAVARVRPGGHRRLALGALVFAGAAAVTSVAATVLAFDARSDFYATELQRPAQEAEARYRRDSEIAISAGALAVAGGIAAWLLWPETAVTVAPAISGDGDVSLSLVMSW